MAATACGVALYYTPNLDMRLAAVYSCLSAILALAAASVVPNRMQSWLFWFTAIFVISYQFGTMIGSLLIGFTSSLLDYPTNFTNSMSDIAIAQSYVVSGMCIAMIWSIAGFVPTQVRPNQMFFDARLFQVGKVLLILTFPVMCVELLDQLLLVQQHGYAFLYSSDFQGRPSRVPAIGLISSVNTLAFFMVFAARPPKRQFWIAAGLFFLISAIDALKGARSALIIPVSFIVWHATTYYGFRISLGRGVQLVGGVALYLFVMQVLRSENDGRYALTFFLTKDLSKAQHILAVVLDNYDLVDVRAIFALEPVLFPIQYVWHGSELVGQSQSTALLRHDLNHTFSSQLNMGAYLNGSGLGTAFAAEAFQFGPAVMLVFVLTFLGFYNAFFRYAQHARFLFLLQPQLFMQLVSSPRGTIFPATWPILKLVIVYGVVLLAVMILPKKTGGLRRRH